MRLRAAVAGGVCALAMALGGCGGGAISSNGAVTPPVGAATSIAVTGGSGQSAVIQAVFVKALTVVVHDANGNAVPNVAVTFSAPATGAGGLFAGAATATAQTGSDGSASSPTLTSNLTAGNFSVTASANGTGSTAFTETNLAGAASSIAPSTGMGQSAQVSAAFATALSVVVKDIGGNLVAGAAVTFTTPASGASGMFAGSHTATATTGANGVATAPALTAGTTSGNFVVTAACPGAGGTTFGETNLTGAAATLTASAGSGQSAKVTAAFTTALAVTVKDADGNVVPGTTVTFSVPASGAGGSFAGSVNTAISNASGIATAPGLSANTVAGAYTVTATAGTATVNFNEINTAGAAAVLTAHAGTPQSAAINDGMAAIAALVTDTYGNPVSGTTVTFTAPATGASANFAGTGITATAVSNATGIAAPAALAANATAGGPYTITATATGTSSATFTLTNNAAVIASLQATAGTPQSTAVGTTFPSPLQVTATDSNGKPVVGATITFAAPAASGSSATGTFTNGGASATALTDGNGVATSAAINANPNTGSFTVSASGTGSASAGFTLSNQAAATAKTTLSDATRLLEQASFGPTPAAVAHVQQVGVDGWINEQLGLPASTYPDPDPSVTTFTAIQQQFFNNAINGGDQLRQRVSFVLSQIFVISGSKIVPQGVAPYLRLLQQDALGNFYNLMQDVTLSPAMGHYLDMVNNDKANAAAGLKANENYAREFMQLFTIGLEELNPDGSQQLDTNGNPIPTYTQNQIDGNAAVMTGWTYPATPGIATASHNPAYWLGPMVAVETNHDATAKTILNNVAVPAGGTAEADLTILMQTVFNHPNVGPFIGKQLIQHLVTSNPSPAYVARIAAVFNNDGTGTRGNVAAVVKAILEDTEARQDNPGSNPNFGHLREPALYVTTPLRELGAATDGAGLANYANNMGQNLFNAGSVFNYFPPDFPLAGTSLVGAEFGVETTATAIARSNFINTLAFGNLGATTSLNFTALNALAAQSDVTALMNQLDTLLTHGEMPAQLKGSIATTVAAIPASTPSVRVQNAIYLIASSSAFKVEY